MNGPRWARGALALLYPRRCPFCDRVLGFETRCAACEGELAGLRLAVPRLAGADHHLSSLTGAAARYRYSGCVRSAILRMKNGGRACYAECFAAELAQEVFGCTLTQKRGIMTLQAAPPLARFDLVVPVPAAKGAARGYDPPELLARPLAAFLGVEHAPGALYKTRRTEKQEGKTARQRLENVRGTYAAAQPARVEGRRVLLVDDVITTGATVSACAGALLAAGALEVFAVGVAETPLKE